MPASTAMEAGEWTRWYCEACQESGGVLIPEHADVLTGARLILDAHRTANPCRGGTETVRVIARAFRRR